MVWESPLGLINFLIRGCLAVSLLITYVLSFKSRSLSTTKLL